MSINTEHLKAAQQLRKEWGRSDAERDCGIKAAEVREIKDICYFSEGEVIEDYLTDIYYTAGTGEKKYPLIVSVHGGGWFYGDKELYSLYAKHMTSGGFAVANFNYRKSPEYLYPAAFEDVCRLMGFLKDNAEKYQIDTDRVFITGDSAGAQLAAQYCVFSTSEKYRKLLPSLNGVSLLKPAGAALNCGIYKIEPQKDEMICSWYLPENMDADTEKSIMNYHEYINSDFPESFIMCSVNDPLMPRSAFLRDILCSLGVKNEYHEYGKTDSSDGHVFHLNMNSPEGKRCNEDETAFFTNIIQRI